MKSKYDGKRTTDPEAKATVAGMPNGTKGPKKLPPKPDLSPNGLSMASRLDRAPRAAGGRTKGKTTVNVIVAPQGGGQPPKPMMMPPQQGPAPPPMPPRPMGPPPGAMPPPGMAPPGAGGPMPPPMMGRKAGGRVEMKYGAGGGKGRLEKIGLEKGR